ncbi:MAG: YceI family protein, partial [Bdellovibrionales bacterium]|nr:YceI family protein [Bdellovibrionales bacterium]
AVVLRDGECKDQLKGKLKIAAKEREVQLPIVISKGNGDSFRVRGNLPIKWSEYGIEDPSILIARLNPIVTIYFDVSLLPQDLKQD